MRRLRLHACISPVRSKPWLIGIPKSTVYMDTQFKVLTSVCMHGAFNLNKSFGNARNCVIFPEIVGVEEEEEEAVLPAVLEINASGRSQAFKLFLKCFFSLGLPFR